MGAFYLAKGGEINISKRHSIPYFSVVTIFLPALPLLVFGFSKFSAIVDMRLLDKLDKECFWDLLDITAASATHESGSTCISDV